VPDYEVQPLSEPRPANAIAAARSQRASRVAAFVGARSDAQLERTIGSNIGLRAVFKAMERMYEPERSGGFEGDVLYELTTSNGTKRWTVHIDSERARAEPRAAADPAVTMKMPLPVFIRIGAGAMNPARAMLDGELRIEGDFTVAGRLGEMFGGDPQW
jgi:putative sterol carrier protein